MEVAYWYANNIRYLFKSSTHTQWARPICASTSLELKTTIKKFKFIALYVINIVFTQDLKKHNFNIKSWLVWWSKYYYLLKSVFSEIRVRTRVQMVSHRPMISWTICSTNRSLFFWRENTWTHVLTQIYEKTDFSILIFFRYRLYIAKRFQCFVLLNLNIRGQVIVSFKVQQIVSSYWNALLSDIWSLEIPQWTSVRLFMWDEKNP